MKKFLPYILILVILANIFAPFSVLVDKSRGVSVEQNKALAFNSWGASTNDNGLVIEWTLAEIVNGNEAHFSLKIEWPEVDTATADGEKLSETVVLKLKNKNTGIETADFDFKSFLKRTDKTDEGKMVISNLVPENKYVAYLRVTQKKGDEEKYKYKFLSFDFDTLKYGSATTQVGTTVTNVKEEGFLPACHLLNGYGPGEGSFLGCMGQLFYFAVFKTTSYIFGLAGKFFDWTFAYSVSDSSYRSTFVTEGWGIIRDTCNLFFIFVLIYAAFGMILSIHSIKAKEIIINVILIGLLINFSLFAGQVLIDTSNILARLFYSSKAINISTDSGTIRSGINKTQSTELGELPISAALVDKVDPQKLILHSSNVQVTEDNFSSGTKATGDRVEIGTFFLIVLMASAVNIVGLIVFLSVGLIFIARVIGLWFALIFAPLAFFSYTVPQMQNIKMVGWKKWWPDTMGLCFVAPIFMFFMYLILMFLQKGFAGLITEQSGPNWVLSVMIPFIFIMMLLMVAKKLAKEYSGEMGQMVTNGVMAVGGAVLGAGIGVAALTSRATVGRLANKFGNSDRLNNLAAGKTADGKELKNKNLFTAFRQKAAIAAKKTTNAGSKGSFDLRQTGIGNALSAGVGLNLNKYTDYAGLDTKKGLGGYAGSQARKIEKEEKFAKTLGYDHHKYEEIGDEIHDAEDKLKTLRAKKPTNANDAAINAAAIRQQQDIIKDLTKDQERVKTGREKEYYEYKRKQSGKLQHEDKYTVERDERGRITKIRKRTFETKRDTQGNIKQFMRFGKTSGAKVGKQMMKEFLEGMAKGAAIGGTAGILGGPLLMGVGAFTGGLIGGVRESVFKYSGTTNIKIGSGHNHVEKTEDRYKEPAAGGGKPAGAHTEHTTEHHDDGAGGGGKHGH
ncbi:hypothetical protein IT400_01160 [Candidatus Nomurabacteria bacterium]|nr:hypothetical protein [Candidatus Nomurabacteria bacterium]